MKLLLIGSNGQLGQDCRHILSPRHTICGLDVPDIDITSEQQLTELFFREKPDGVINCAAYTAVDQGENDQKQCLAVNACGPELLARLCDRYTCRLIHISTDYVYDGKKPVPQSYNEDDITEPVSMYGKSKLLGDQAVINNTNNYLILRTAWLYGMGGGNFLKTMLRLALTDPERTIRVVNDQYGSLTWSWRLARQIDAVLEQDITGICHASAENYSTWYEGARFFLDCMDVPYSLEPCTTDEYPTPAARPANSILANNRLKEAGLNVMVDWQEDIRAFVRANREALLAEAL
ncbi:MAG: dTDP-4-dehydrorhamnose reductase [Desulfobulbus propionicus]|nr:MAG: dTDP-4-dehydrorhamnose reductase [Desulfobulbus propionicus]